MSSHRLLALSCLLAPLAVSALSACGGKVGEQVRPKDVTGAQALGANTPTCTGEPKLARPFIIDLDADARMDLEARMKKGVVVVAFDCASMRVLPNCSAADTGYEYAGTTRNEQVVQVKGADELRANMPFSAGKLQGEVQSGRTIDLGLVLVGKKSTVVSRVDADKLKGAPGACDGASHFVGSAVLGAFTMSQGTVGKVAAVAELFKAGGAAKSESSRMAATVNGSLDACRTSKDDADAPPEDCRAPIRIELVPISKAAPKKTDGAVAAKEAAKKEEDKPQAKAEENPCPTGMVWSKGLCTSAATAAASGGFLCDESKPEECKAQCAKGNAGSCYNYGVHADRAQYRDDPSGKELAKLAPEYFKKACDGDHADGCAEYADAVGPGIGKKVEDHLPEFKKSIEIGKKACSLGSGRGCAYLGMNLGRSWVKETHDPAGAFGAYKRGCQLGDSFSCKETAEAYIKGEGTSKNPQKGLDLLQKSCAGGDDTVCVEYIEVLKEGRGVKKDLATAELYAILTCLTNTQACELASDIYLELGKNDDAVKYAKMACDESLAYCGKLQEMYATGKGAKKDPAKAREILKKMCDDEIVHIIVGDDKCAALDAKKPAVKPTGAKKPVGKK